MSEKLTFVPVAEAARIIGVTAQTIRNLCKAKTLRYQMRGNLFYVCREDIKRYAASILEVNQIERTIEEYTKELLKATEQVRIAKQEMYDRLENMQMFPDRIKNITLLLTFLVPHLDESITQREMEIVLMVLKGEKIVDVAEKVHLTRDRTRQIWEKAVRKLSYFPEELHDRDKRIEDLSRTIQELRAQIKEAGILPVPNRNDNLLSSSIFNYDFSVRTLNCLKAAEIRTVDDLIRCPREHLLKFRNFGKKGLAEIDEWLAAHNLSFAESGPSTKEEKLPM